MIDGREIPGPGTQVNYITLTKADDLVEPHSHPYDHWSAVLTGSVVEVISGRVLRAGDALMNFVAGCEHGFRALEDDSAIISVIDTTQATWEPGT